MAESSSEIGVSARELDVRMEEIRRAVDIATAASGSRVELREHVEALFQEMLRATEIAERERSKAAKALADSLAHAIREGDERLREHIANQIAQIEAALTSAEKLSNAQVDKLQAEVSSVEQRSVMRHGSMQDQMAARFESTSEAVAKAETATDKRFESSNGLRDQMLAQAASFLPREVAEAQFAEMRRTISDLTEKVSKIA